MAQVLLVVDRAGVEGFGLEAIQEGEQMAVVVEYHIHLAVHVDVDEVEERDLGGLLAGVLLLRVRTGLLIISLTRLAGLVVILV